MSTGALIFHQLGTSILLAVCLMAAQRVLLRLAGLIGMRTRIRFLGLLSVAVGLIAVAPFLLSGKLLFPGLDPRTLPGSGLSHSPGQYELLSDVPLQLLPWEGEVRRILAQGALPYWSGRIAAGEPLWANPQAQVLSPISMVARLFPLKLHLLAALALKVSIVFSGASLLALRLGSGRRLALFAGGASALGGSIAAWSLFPITAAVAWLPWFLHGCVLLARSTSNRITASTGVLASLLLVSGHPETALFGGLLGVAFAYSFRRRTLRPTRLGAKLAFVGVLGFSLSAIVTLPFLLTVSESQRFAEASASRLIEPWRYEQGPLALAFDPASWKMILAPIAPEVYGRPYAAEFRGPFNWAEACGGFSGSIAFAGWLLALLAPRAPAARRVAVLTLIAMLLSAKFRPLMALGDAVPWLNALSFHRWQPLVGLLVALAGALGWRAALGQGRRRRNLWTVGAAAAGSLLLAATPVACFVWTVVFFSASVRRFRVAAAALLAVQILELAPWFWSMQPSAPPSAFYPTTTLIESVRDSSVDADLVRVVGSEFTAYPNLLSLYGLSDPRPHNPITFLPYRAFLARAFHFETDRTKYFSSFDASNASALARIGVGKVIHPGSEGNGRAPWIEDRSSLPIAFAPTRIDCIRDAEVEDWLGRQPDARAIALVDAAACDAQHPAPPDAVRAIRARSDGLVAALARESQGLLATSLVAVPGWTATRGGLLQETPTILGAFLGVSLSGSGEELILRYRPPGILPGSALSVLAVLYSGWIFRKRSLQAASGRRE